jgi:heme/copper-type cytochrome/quinol oxidase subunit 1
VVQQIGKDASLLFPVAFGFANLALAGGLGAFATAPRRREALSIIIFCVLLLIPLVVMLIRIRTGRA